MGISIRAYARHRGVSHVAVKKAIDTGRITPLSDGTIDPETADREWAQNTTTPRSKTTTESAVKSPKPEPTVMRTQEPAEPFTGTPSTSTSLVQARTANEVVKAQTNKIRLAQLKGELVDRSQAVAHVFKLARAERDAWLNWPARVSSQMAAELGVDSHLMHVTLEKAVREQLIDLGDLKPKVD